MSSALDPALPASVLQADGTNPLVVLVVGVAIAGLAALGILRTFVLYRNFGAGGERSPAASKTNCPACGARIPADDPNCEYCGERIDGRSSEARS